MHGRINDMSALTNEPSALAEEDARLRISEESVMSHINFMMKQNLDVADYKFDRQIGAEKQAEPREYLNKKIKDDQMEKRNNSFTHEESS